jgi:hypothetical protein
MMLSVPRRSNAFLRGCAALQGSVDAAAGSDEDAAVWLPVVIGELCSALERLTGPEDLRQQVLYWLERTARAG